MAVKQGEIVNKVKQSKKLVTIDLEKYYDDTEIIELDLKDFLFKGLILKEDHFREQLDQHDWDQYSGNYVTVFCSVETVIPKWAYMIVAQKVNGIVKDIFEGRKDNIRFELFRRKLESVDWSSYKDKFVLLKGCSNKPVPASVYLYATNCLLPYVQKLMYGEACSNVPVYRKPR